MPFQAFGKDQEWHGMCGPIESRFMGSNDQRLFNQKAVDVVLKNTVSHLVFIRLQSILDQIVLKANNTVEKRHLKKLDALRRRKVKKGSRTSLLDPVTNLSSRVLTDEERAALTNGLHHVYPSAEFDQAQFICKIEYFYARLLNIRTAYQHYERRSADVVVRYELTSTQLHGASQLRSMANTVRRTAQLEMKKVGKDHRRPFEILRSLAKDRSIIITRPDKGRGVVILDRSEYLTKMYTILDDPQSFRRIEADTTLVSKERFTIHLRRRILTCTSGWFHASSHLRTSQAPQNQLFSSTSHVGNEDSGLWLG